MSNNSNNQAGNDALWEKIRGFKVAMLTTIDRNHNLLRSRPMVVQEAPFDGNLWFFTHIGASLVDEAENRQVNISYAAPDEDRYVSVSGVAQLVRDPQKNQELWTSEHESWFAGGKDDPGLALLKVTVTGAEVWDSPSKQMVHILQPV